MRVPMKQLGFWVLLAALGLGGCVSKKKYLALAEDFSAAQDSARLVQNLLRAQVDAVLAGKAELEDSLLAARVVHERTARLLREARKTLAVQNEDYQRLKSEATTEMLNTVAKLELARQELYNREILLAEAKHRLATRDSALGILRDRIQESLVVIDSSDLTVDVRGGAVHVVLRQNLLFRPGRTDLNAAGVQALLDLAKVLNRERDLEVLVEGHTDPQPVEDIKCIEDNWDLSVLRATAVARVLIGEGHVNPKRIRVGGRAEHAPLASNGSAEGRARNRRTEIVLAPNLDELFELVVPNE